MDGKDCGALLRLIRSCSRAGDKAGMELEAQGETWLYLLGQGKVSTWGTVRRRGLMAQTHCDTAAHPSVSRTGQSPRAVLSRGSLGAEQVQIHTEIRVGFSGDGVLGVAEHPTCSGARTWQYFL